MVHNDRGSEGSGAGGIGFFGALTLLFVGLKLGDVITWSWWWVLCPMWFPAAVVLLAFIFFGIIIRVADSKADRAARKVRDMGPDDHGPARRWGGK